MKRIIMESLQDELARDPVEEPICKPWSIWQHIAVAAVILLGFVIAMQAVPGN